MKFNEYDDRFRRPAPSWHQILAANQTRNPIRLRKRRYLLAAALMCMVIVTMDLASHCRAPDHGGTGAALKPGFHLSSAEFRRILDFFEASGQAVVAPRHIFKTRSAWGDR